MRPILLEFAGLQSYREPQRLDFTELLGGGLFGIFGPTGSGKSTILDAITLALYGSVERAQGSIRGIMNQSEPKLWVRFTFALKAAEGEKQYRAERGFARDKEGNVRTAQCRLVEITPLGEVVLADKEGALTDTIEEILGLQKKDFTKAVVLPQGKFSEFLQMKDSDRRAMMERILGLEQYGDRLSKKLKTRVTEGEARLQGVIGQQTGLGDASEDAVAAAATAANEAGDRLTAAEAAFQQAAAAAKAMERVWELQQQLDQVEAAFTAWQARGAEVAQQRTELDAALRAEPVQAPLEEQARAAQRAQSAAESLQQTESELGAARTAEGQATQAHEAARSEREQKGPVLTERRHALQRAVALEQEAAGLVGRVQDLASRVAKGRELLAQTEAAVVQHEATATGLASRLTEAMARQSQVEVPPEQRERVQTARLAWGRLTEADNALRQAEVRLTARENDKAAALAVADSADAANDEAARALTAAEAALRHLEDEPPATEDDLRANEGWLARAEGHVAAVAEAARRLLEAAQAKERAEAEAVALQEQARLAEADEAEALAARTAAEKAVDEARRQSHAAALVTALTPGVPCPVCGSTHHPAPAAADGAEALAAAEAAFRQADADWQAAGRRSTECRMRWEAAAGRVSAADLEAAQRSHAEALARLPETWSGGDLRALLEAERAAHAARRQSYQTWRTAVDEARRQRDDQLKAAGQAASGASSAAARAAAATSAAAEAAAEREQVAAVLERRQAEYDQVGLPDLEAAEERIKAADAELSRLRREIAELNAGKQRVESQLADDRATKDRYTTALHQREMEHAQASSELEAKQAELAALTGGASAGPLLAAAEAELRRLESAEADAARAHDSATARRTRAEAAQAAASREHELAVQRAGEAEAALVAALAGLGFPDAAAAQAARRTPERRQWLEAAVTAHDREGAVLADRRSSLETLLGSQRLTQEAWAEAGAALTAARTEVDARREEKARADQALEVLRTKQEQWRQLEAQRQELETRLNHMAELQRLLRGNAFVEFLAEEQMAGVALEASARLGQLTRYRYALEVDSGGGFVIRDDGNGGMRRAVTTLSGGETFLTSLALALALSAQIQLRGHYPLEFFFLDEGFGTLDPELLNLVIDTLERLHFEQLHVGVISHVPELRARLQRRVIVEPAEPGGRGSRLTIERA